MNIFRKYNYINNDSLIKEVKGLELLKEKLDCLDENHIKIPKIYSVSKELLELEKIATTSATFIQMRDLGVSLANLHKLKFDKFGLEYNNYIGLGIQKNSLFDNWGEFFLEYRLKAQVSIIKDISIKNEFSYILEKNGDKLISFLNKNLKHSSLVHGDLWSGNVMFSKSGIYLIDPAIYYGDSEVDIAMSEMFGGFQSSFYEGYAKRKKLSNDYESKKIIYNLYHYLNHYNLFGLSYLSTCQSYFKFISKI